MTFSHEIKKIKITDLFIHPQLPNHTNIIIYVKYGIICIKYYLDKLYLLTYVYL